MPARSQEYWRPADPEVARAIDVTVKEAFCWNCGTPYSAAAAYCQACGSARSGGPQAAPAAGRKTPALRLRLPLVCLVFLIVGLGCFAAALLTSAIYRTDTLVDWQAVQVWRVEWLLAGCGAMLAAIVLRLGHR
jgi:zinc ribbon protein